MSVINQVLKDLDRQGANTSAPQGVIAVNTDASAGSQLAAPAACRSAIGTGCGLVVLAGSAGSSRNTGTSAAVPAPLVEQLIKPQLTPFRNTHLPSADQSVT
jgi:hypothetical protein